MLDNVITQGGYWPTPAEAREEDEIILVLQGIYTIADINMNPLAAEWRFLDSTKPSSGAWLRQQDQPWP